MSVTTRAPFCVRGILYTTKGAEGDFQWMIKQPQYNNTLFIFMENFVDAMRQDSEAGGGTACLRPYSLYHQPDSSYKLCAAGVPTGWSHETHGFSIMDADVKQAIDLFVFCQAKKFFSSSAPHNVHRATVPQRRVSDRA